jgi:Domain of unknown function (DUF1707)/Cell wall-active antibiotics response 4TMS YvqF
MSELSGPGSPQPRASDSDRDRTLEFLSTAAGDGRLTPEEYAARADRALAARFMSELAELTADLPRGPAHPVRELERVTAILSSESRKGPWTVPARLKARALLGDCHIELQNAALTSHVTRIDVRATLGSVTISVPDGVEVRLSGRSILGSRSSRTRKAPVPGAPVIDVRATAILGAVSIRPPSLAARVRAHLSGG